MLADLQIQVRSKEDEGRQLDSDFEYWRQCKEDEGSRVKAQTREVQKKKDTIANEIQCINEDYKLTFDRKMRMGEEMKEIKETIEIINTDLSQKEEEILRVRIKIR